MTENVSTIKQNLALCVIAGNGVNNTSGSPVYVHDKIVNSLELSLATKDDFELVWGPAVVRNDDNDGDDRDDYVLYMVRNKKDSRDFRLAIRFTLSVKNSAEDFNFVPDFKLNKYIPAAGDDVCITRGMGTVLDDIWDVRSNNSPGLGKTVVEFIREQLTSAEGEGLSLTVCGHSFGGMVAPVLGIYLQSQLSNDNVEVKIHSGGATTVGNKEFADYINGCFGENYTRLVNEHDITGYLWDVNEMPKILDLYSPDYEADILFKIFFLGIRDVLAFTNMGGTQAGQVVSFTQKLNVGYDSYGTQALYQHSAGFLDYYEIGQTTENELDIIMSTDNGDA